jgi:glucan phosphoethanolaminetransferase (alkaline phosphatase superfamily)
MVASSDGLEEKWFWVTLNYLGYLVALQSFIVFSARYSGLTKLGRGQVAALAASSASFFIVVLTNNYHHLFYSSFSISPNVYRPYEAEYGTLFYLYYAYIIAAYVSGVAILFLKLIRSSKAFKRSIGTVFAASFLVLVVAIIILVTVNSNPGVFLLLTAFIASSALLFVGAFWFELRNGPIRHRQGHGDHARWCHHSR